MALIGITSERKVVSSNTKAANRTNPNTSGRCEDRLSVKSRFSAVRPSTFA
jgi:hypothetical protein